MAKLIARCGIGGAYVKFAATLDAEVDALPVDVLRQRLIAEVESRMDLDALEELKVIEKRSAPSLFGLYPARSESGRRGGAERRAARIAE